MRRTWLISAGLLVLAGRLALAQEPRRVQQDAAVEAARLDLRNQVLATDVAPGLTVGAVLQRLKIQLRSDQLVEPAIQLGGSRWIDDQTCQIKLHLDAAAMGQKLRAIVAQAQSSSILQQIDAALEGPWKNLSFEATGTSVPPDRVMALIPASVPRVWETVPADERRKCVSASHQSAVNTIVAQLSDLVYDNRTSVGNHLNPDSRAKLQGWAETMPVTRANYRDDKQVEVQVYVDQQSLRDKLKAVLPTDAAPTTQLSQHIDALPRIVIGTAGLSGAHPAAVSSLDVPSWIDTVLTSSAKAHGRPTKLLTAREAETTAIAKLRQTIEALPFDARSTIGDRVKADPKCSRALDRLIERSRVSKVTYQADDSVDVTVTLDPNEVWDEVAGWR